jgi:hypothetical protein
MDNSEIKKPHRIPVEEDYSATADVVEDAFRENGGAWVMYHKESILGIHTKESARDFFETVSTLARLVEPIEDDRFKPVDSMYRATHAFKAGLWTGGQMSHVIHNGRLRFEQIYNEINKSLPYTPHTDREEYEENGQYLTKIGHLGLELIGYEARQKLEEWGNDIVSDSTARPFFALGAGAILATSQNIYSLAYPLMDENYQVAQLLNFDEIDQFLNSSSDSSSN